MKKSMFLISVMTAILLLAGCCAKEMNQAPAPTPVPVHHDYKGEVGKG